MASSPPPPQQSSTGSAWRRLFGGEEPPPPPPPKPPDAWHTIKDGAWDSVKVGNRTLADIAGTMYNENKGLRAGDSKRGYAGQEELDRGSLGIGHALINASRKGIPRKQAASSAVSKEEMASPLYQHYLGLARQALEEDSRGADPLNGRTQYNHRFNNDKGPRKTEGGQEKFVEAIGPFKNAGSRTLPTARIVFYDKAESKPQLKAKPAARPKPKQ